MLQGRTYTPGSGKDYLCNVTNSWLSAGCGEINDFL